MSMDREVGTMMASKKFSKTQILAFFAYDDRSDPFDGRPPN